MKSLAIIILSVGLLFASVDVNNADKKELMTLTGVGEKRADSIIKRRKDKCFENVNEITEIKGLGLKFIEKNKQNLKVGKCKK